MKTIYKVYQHRKKDTNEIFYVGYGKNSRPRSFTRGRSKAWLQIYANSGCLVDILATFNNAEEAAALEAKIIAEYREAGVPLVNVKDGGFDRDIGCPHSDEAKKKISQARLKTNASRKKTKTPLGIFASKVLAANAHKIHVDTLSYRIRTNKPGYAYV